MTAVLMMLTVQCVLGGFDNLWHHEITEKLPQRPGARAELALHATRELLYALIFISVAWYRWQGLCAFALALILLIEIAVTLADFVIEDRTRRLPRLERILHTVLAINFGALLALWFPEFLDWAAMPTGVAAVHYGAWSWLMTVFGIGVFAWGLRDMAAVIRLGLPEWQRNPVRARLVAAPRSVLVTGGTGFIGRALIRALLKRGDRVLVLARDPVKAWWLFGPRAEICEELKEVPAARRIDAVVNLAGEPLTGGLWTRARKQRFRDSRVGITSAVHELIARLERKPEVLISGSAIGYYGDRADEELREDSGPQPIFMSDICREWETAALEIEAEGVRVCCLRIGLVLGAGGGVLPAIALPVRFGLGAVFGGGGQYMSWIHLRDLVQLILFALQQPALSGPINAVAPAPVRHREFMQTLATTLQRRILLCIPGKLVRRMLGELSDLFLTSQRLTPERVIAAGFQFQYADVPAAFEDIFGAAPQPATPLAVYSNDNCSVCRGEMAQYRAANARAGHPIEFKAISASHAAMVAYGLSEADLRRRLYAVDRAGRVWSGVEAFIAIWSVLPGYHWAARFARAAGLRAVFALTYEGACVPLLGGIGCRALTDRAKSAVRLNKETIAGLPDRDGLAPFAVVHGSGCASFTPNLAREWVAASTGRGMVLEMT